MTTASQRFSFLLLIVLSGILPSCSREEDDEFCYYVLRSSVEEAQEYQCPNIEEAKKRWLHTDWRSQYIVSFESGPVKKIHGYDLDCCYQVKVTENL